LERPPLFSAASKARGKKSSKALPLERGRKGAKIRESVNFAHLSVSKGGRDRDWAALIAKGLASAVGKDSSVASMVKESQDAMKRRKDTRGSKRRSTVRDNKEKSASSLSEASRGKRDKESLLVGKRDAGKKWRSLQEDVSSLGLVSQGSRQRRVALMEAPRESSAGKRALRESLSLSQCTKDSRKVKKV
jgi:hypothetical protein